VSCTNNRFLILIIYRGYSANIQLNHDKYALLIITLVGGPGKTDENMRRTALGLTLILTGLTACTTVDLSQVAVKQQSAIQTTPKLNVVEKASASLTSLFRDKGWSRSGPKQKTQTATSIFLNGMNKNTTGHTATPVMGNATRLSADLKQAVLSVNQTTKAAEVFLAMADGATSLDRELSSLETALLSAHEAQTRFGKSITLNSSSANEREFQALQHSITALKTVTNSYGDRIRQQIATRSIATRS